MPFRMDDGRGIVGAVLQAVFADLSLPPKASRLPT